MTSFCEMDSVTRLSMFPTKPGNLAVALFSQSWIGGLGLRSTATRPTRQRFANTGLGLKRAEEVHIVGSSARFEENGVYCAANCNQSCALALFRPQYPLTFCCFLLVRRQCQPRARERPLGAVEMIGATCHRAAAHLFTPG